MEKKHIILVLCLLVLLAAVFWNSITGLVIAEETAIIDEGTTFADIDDRCTDSDRGVFSDEYGIVFYRFWKYFGTAKPYPDYCTGTPSRKIDAEGKPIVGYSKIREAYCDASEVKQFVEKGAEELGAGYCILNWIEDPGWPTKVLSAKWVAEESRCIEDSGIIKDENGRVYRDKCEGNTFIEYKCDGANVEEERTDCPVRCSIRGCIGNCVDTDEADNIDVGGSVTLDGTEYLDTCNGNNIIQYSCSNGVLGSSTSFCGINRECMESASGSFCKDKYTGTSTTESLDERIDALETLVDDLTARIEALENGDSSEE